MRTAVLAAILLSAALCPGQTPPKAPPAAKAPKVDVRAMVHAHVEATLAAAADSLPMAAAASDLQGLFDQIAAYAPEAPGALAEADFAVRLATQLSKVPETSQKELLVYLRKHEELAHTLVFLIGPKDAPKAVYGVLDRLRAEFADQPGEFPALAAAICVVHDVPIRASAVENPREKPTNIDPVDVFRFYSTNAGRMVFNPRTLPAELLVYVVDSTARPDELEWALAHHAGDRNIGKQYNTIVYDTGFFKYDKPKKIESLPYTLENIRKVGGVCLEQAYYVSNAGKAIGVPCVLIIGQSATVGHAWAGVCQARGSGYGWDLEEGCFGEYKKLRGNIVDPQSRQRLAAPELNLLAQLMSTPEADRRTAVACADAAQRLAALDKQNARAWPPAAPAGLEGVKAKPGGIVGAMAFLERAVKLAPTSVPVWTGLAPMARHMSDADRIKWSEALLRSCEASPDFTYRIMGLMIESLDDPASQAQVWAWVAGHWNRRPDLKVGALLAQGAALEKAGDKGGAYACYEDVWQHWLNDAAEAADSIARAEALLKASNKQAAILNLYADAFRRVARPSSTSSYAFNQSSFYRIGERYAKCLEDAGRGGEAKGIRSQIQRGIAKE